MVLKLESNFLSFHKGALSNRKACRRNDFWKMQHNNSRSCGPIYMFGISHVQKAAWNLVTVTLNTLFLSQINEQLENWKLIIGHLKLLEKNNISSTNVHQEHILLPNHLARWHAWETNGSGTAEPPAFETPLATSIVCSMRFGCHMGSQFCNAKSRGRTFVHRSWDFWKHSNVMFFVGPRKKEVTMVFGLTAMPKTCDELLFLMFLTEEIGVRPERCWQRVINEYVG